MVAREQCGKRKRVVKRERADLMREGVARMKHTHTNTQIERVERQTDRQIDRQAGRETDRETDRQTYRDRDIQTDRETDKQANRHTETDRQV